MGFFDNFARSVGLRDERTITYSDCEQLYRNGNYKKAFERCLKFTMENDDPRVWTMLGDMYRTGKGCMVNPAESFNWMLKAATVGIPEAEYYVGKMFEDGFGTNKDPTEYLMWLTKAANHSWPEAAFELGDLYSAGEKIQYDQKLAYHYYLIAAKQGYPQAECALGLIYYTENASAANYYQAIKWFKKAAQHGMIDANYNLAQAYIQNRFPGRNLDEYIKNITIAAQGGIDAAVMELGCAYFDGFGVPRNYAKALEWLQNPLLCNNVEALKKLGFMYEMGLGTETDRDKAYDIYVKAANLGSSFAKYKLGSFMYNNGNKTEAFRWYQASAEHAFPLAQARLAEMYYLGDGVAIDHKKSYLYAYFAARLGVPGFTDNIDKYKMGLTEVDVANIEKEVNRLLSPVKDA
ncbi:MAG: sel1 repeat family protein [Succinivibrionaceae bacterium]|nr:sel1 repeat family protein [Succinivibrionaceae bacterium]